MMSDDNLYNFFPGLVGSPHKPISDATDDYNCFAFAAGINTERWEPSLPWYWPRGAPRRPTREALVAAFRTLHYEPCDGADLEEGFEKVALYASGNLLTHAARQLPSGTWISKLGSGKDIEHKLEAIEGEHYGQVFQIMRRRAPIK